LESIDVPSKGKVSITDLEWCGWIRGGADRIIPCYEAIAIDLVMELCQAFQDGLASQEASDEIV